MSGGAARAVMQRLATDKEFAAGLERVAHDPAASLAWVVEHGYDVTVPDLQAAYIERFGDRLTIEELDHLSGGANGWSCPPSGCSWDIWGP